MSAVLWGNLSYDILDPTTITEYVEGQLLNHNEDPSAHGQSNEAIEIHRVATVLDHIDEAVTNAKIFHFARVYRAIVDIAGNGDYDNIQDAVDYVAGIGGGSILILAGTYTQSTDITMYSLVNLIGEDKDTTIIDFNYGDLNITLPASGSHIEISNLTIKKSRDIMGAININGSSDVEISENEFTLNSSADHWSCGDIFAYTGATDLKILNNHSDYSGFFFCGFRSKRVYIQKNYIEHNYLDVINLGSCNKIYIQNNIIENAVNSYGAFDIYIEESAPYTSDFIFIQNNSLRVSSNSVIVILAGDQIFITNNIIENPDFGCGILADSVDRIKIIGNDISLCEEDGIQLYSASNKTIISGNVVYSNDAYGININNSNCNNTIIDSNAVYLNSTANIRDIGTGTVIGDNYAP